MTTSASASGTPIETAGATDLTKVGNNYYFYAHGTTTGPTVKYSGAAVVAGQFGAWAPIAAEAIAGGYEVAWKYGSADQYTVWKTDSSGNYVSTLIPAVSGTDPNLEAIEPSFQQDLNRDGVTGIVGTPIETAGATDLTKVGNNYYFYAHGTTTGPTVKYSGAAVVAGQFGAWAPIAAEAIAGGYEVAWKYGSADQYTVWKTDSSGNYVSTLIPAVSGTDPNLEAIEPSFQQDLNRDGVTGTNFPPSADDGAPVETLVTAINVGGQQFTAANGITYLADPGPTQGAAASNTFWTSADIVSTNDDPLYNTERWTPGGSYTYEIPVANGTYRVELNFAEIFGGITGAGQRVFDMSLENQPLPSLQNIDIYGQVGANAPLVIDQLITVTDGSLSIQVGPGSDSPGNVQNAKLNAFSVFNEGGASTSIGFSSVTATSLSGGSDTTPSPSTAGETATSAPKTITVTDPPAATLTSANAPLKTSSGSNRSATADNHLAPNIDRAVWLSELKPYDLPSAIALDWASELRPSTIGGLDPSDIAFVSRTTHNSYGADGNSTGGGLTESDSMLAANIALLSQYMAAAFVKSMDGFDGTLIHDAASVTKMEMLALPQHG